MKYALILMLIGLVAILAPRLKGETDRRRKISRWIRFGVLAAALLVAIWLH